LNLELKDRAVNTLAARMIVVGQFIHDQSTQFPAHALNSIAQRRAAKANTQVSNQTRLLERVTQKERA